MAGQQIRSPLAHHEPRDRVGSLGRILRHLRRVVAVFCYFSQLSAKTGSLPILFGTILVGWAKLCAASAGPPTHRLSGCTCRADVRDDRNRILVGLRSAHLPRIERMDSRGPPYENRAEQDGVGIRLRPETTAG